MCQIFSRYFINIFKYCFKAENEDYPGFQPRLVRIRGFEMTSHTHELLHAMA